MRNISVRELRSAIPRLGETLEDEHELILISHGEPVARILPFDGGSPGLESLQWLRDMAPAAASNAGDLIRQERDRRGT